MNFLFGSPRARRAISPVIATVLIIAVTVSAAAVVWVIVNNQLDDDLPTLSYEVQNSMDYNNDGKIDLLQLKVRNIASNAANTSYVSNDAWEVMPGSNIVLKSNEEAIIMIGTNSLSAQFEAKEEVRIGVGPFENKFKIATFKVGDPIVPAGTTVTVSSGGDPIVGVSVTFVNDEGLPAVIPPITTNGNGQAVAYLLPDYYVAKTSSGQSSDQFHNVISSQVAIGSSGERIYVKVIDDLNQPISGIAVYDADLSQNDLGAAGVTDINGEISFVETDGSYLFRANYLSIDYWSSSVTVPGSSNVTIKLTTNAELVGLLLFGGDPAGINKLLRLFTSTNASMGKYDYTNSSSYFEFRSGVSPGLYRLRLDFQGNYYWSGLLSTSDPNLEVDFGGGDMNILVTAGGAPLPNGVLTRLFSPNNVSMGRYDYLNSSGIAEYASTPGGYYRLRIDWLGKYTYTSLINHQDASLVEVDIGGGPLNVLVTAGGSPLPNGVLTRLFNANNASAGRYDYLNASGHAEYGAIPEGSYRLRVDWLGQYVYTTSFIHDGSPQYMDVGGGSLKVLVTAGGAPLPNGVLTRLYTATNVSAGRYDYLNASGVAEYGAIFGGDYRLRVDWLGQYIYTTSFSVIGSDLLAVDIGGGALNVRVLAGGTPLPNGVLTRLYNAANSSTGRYDYLNASGWAEYGAIPDGTYSLRIDWLGKYTYTITFVSDGSPQSVDVGGGLLNINVEIGGVGLPNGVLTRLYLDTGASTGRYDYLNGTGGAEYGAIIGGNYKLRIDWMGQYIYTSIFLHDGQVDYTLTLTGVSSMTLTVTDDSSAMGSGQLIRLYNADTNSNTGRYAYTDGSGQVIFATVPAGNYYLVYNGRISDDFVATASATININP